MALDHNRRHRPDAYSQIPNPAEFFAGTGEEIAAQVSRLRDEILGSPRPSESAESHRLRSYQALAMAEELILADHHLLQPEPSSESQEDWSDDPDLDRHYQYLAAVNRAINTPL
ncbi:MAG TPA: hypothetical protein VIR58_03585 [Acidimicrobiales bacterium]